MRAKVSELCLFAHVSDSVLIRTDLMDSATSSLEQMLSSTPRESSDKCLRHLSRFRLSADTSELLTSEWFDEDDFGEYTDGETDGGGLCVSHSIPDGIPPPRLQLADSDETTSIVASVTDTDSPESEESGCELELLPDDLLTGDALLIDEFSSGFLNFGLTLASDDEKEEDSPQYYGSSAEASSIEPSLCSEQKHGGNNNMFFAKITACVSEQKQEDGDHLDEANDIDTVKVLIPAAVEGKQAAAVRSLSHYRTQRDAANAKESMRAKAGSELLKRQRNADGTRRFDFSVYVDISQTSVDHILCLLHDANLM